MKKNYIIPITSVIVLMSPIMKAFEPSAAPDDSSLQAPAHRTPTF